MLMTLLLSLLMVQTGQTSPPTPQAPAEDAKKALEKIQGSWQVVSFNGQELPSGAEAYLVFKGDKYEQWTGTTVDERGTVKLDPSTKPASIDLMIAEGQDAGKLQLGLMDLTGETLSLAFAEPGNPVRPKAPGDAALIAILKKSK